MLTEENIFEKLKENKIKLEKFGVQKIGLFGSYRRGEQKEDSDIDFLVKFKEGEKTFENYMGLRFFLRDLFGREVNLLTPSSIKPSLKPHITKEVAYAEGL